MPQYKGSCNFYCMKSITVDPAFSSGFYSVQVWALWSIAGSLDRRLNWCQEWDATRTSAKQQELEEQMAGNLWAWLNCSNSTKNSLLGNSNKDRKNSLATSWRNSSSRELRAELRDLRKAEEKQRREPRPETRPSSLLRPSASEFICLLTPLLTGADGSVPRAGATQRPPLYDGHSSWDAYIIQFEMLPELNRWSEVEKATLLAVSLRGAASTVLSNLPADRRSDYRTLVTPLENCFGTTHQAELNRMKLRNRTRKREESLDEQLSLWDLASA